MQSQICTNYVSVFISLYSQIEGISQCNKLFLKYSELSTATFLSFKVVLQLFININGNCYCTKVT